MIMIGCGGIVLIMATPRIRRGAQRINRYRKSLLKKYRYKKFIKSTKIVKYQKDDCVICFDDYSENNKLNCLVIPFISSKSFRSKARCHRFKF